MATPGRIACAMASPRKAIERSTTKQPSTEQTTPTISAAASARCMKSRVNGSVSQSIMAPRRRRPFVSSRSCQSPTSSSRSCQSSSDARVRDGARTPSPTWPGQHWSMTTMPSRKSAWPPKAAARWAAVKTSGRPAVGDQVAVEQGDELEALRGGLHVVGRDEHGDARRAQTVEQLEHRLLGAHVDAGEGLVEQQDVRLLGERAGEKDALLLPAGELADRPPGEVGDAELLERAAHRLAVGRLRPLQRPQPAVAPHHDDVGDGHREAPVDLLALRHVGDGVGLVAGRAPVDEHPPAAARGAGRRWP